MPHQHNDHCVGVELQGVYDGVAYWECHDGKTRHRFQHGPIQARVAAAVPGIDWADDEEDD